MQACAQSESTGAWEEFMRRYHLVLTTAAIRVSRQWGRGGSDEIDDIVQEIYLRLCADHARILTSFRDSRPEAMFGYLKVVGTNIAHDFFRRRSAAKRGSEKTARVEEAAAIPAPFHDMERQLSLVEIDQMLLVQTEQKNNGTRDRAVFRLYYRHGLTAQAIAELPGIGLNSKGVEGVLHRLTRAIRHAFGEVQGLGAE
jgi:RNA polymerase sigma-70 factor, ECF subfamily